MLASITCQVCLRLALNLRPEDVDRQDTRHLYKADNETPICATVD